MRRSTENSEEPKEGPTGNAKTNPSAGLSKTVKKIPEERKEAIRAERNGPNRTLVEVGCLRREALR